MDDVEGFLEWPILQGLEQLPGIESNEGVASADPRGEFAWSVLVTASVRGLGCMEGGDTLQLGLL